MAFSLFLFENPVTNNVDPDQMPHTVASDLGQQCFRMSHLQVSRLERGLRR